jgi:threonine aldolase
VWNTPGDEPAAPGGFYAACAAGDMDDLVERFGDAKDDPLLAAEVASLRRVHDELGTGQYVCVIIEPMQSEGGDRYATERFFRALRLLTRRHDTLLVMDGSRPASAWAARSRARPLPAHHRGQPDYPEW